MDGVLQNWIMGIRKTLLWMVSLCVGFVLIVLNKDSVYRWSSIKYFITNNLTKTRLDLVRGNNRSNKRNMTHMDSNYILNPSQESNNMEATWYKKRQEIISKREPGDTIKVFVFAHMRGGSTLSGRIFESDQHAVMWYEPGDAFFSYYYGVHTQNQPKDDLYFHNMTRRILDGDEKKALADFYTDKFTCQYQKLPPEALAHHFLELTNSFMSFKTCIHSKIRQGKSKLNQCKQHISPMCKTVESALANNCHGMIEITKMVMKQNPNISDATSLAKSIQELIKQKPDFISKFIHHQQCLNRLDEDNHKCMSEAVKDCESHTLQMVQVNRMKMEDLETLIQTNPDIYVIHYVRDPRGIALSRQQVAPNGWTVLNESRYLCHRMAEDLRQRHILERKYPGAFLQVRYEDLAAHPMKTVSDIYSFLGRDPPWKWKSFVDENMHAANAANHSDQGTRVGDAVATANKWKTLIPKNELQTIEGFCGGYLKEMNYTHIV